MHDHASQELVFSDSLSIVSTSSETEKMPTLSLGSLQCKRFSVY